MNAIIHSKLALERCRNYIAHIHAVMALDDCGCGERESGLSAATADTIRHIASILDKELAAGYRMLELPDDTLKTDETPPPGNGSGLPVNNGSPA